MGSVLRHRLPFVEGSKEPFTSGFLGQNPPLSAPNSNSNGTTVIGQDQSQQIIGNIYETFKIDHATFVQSDDDRQRLKFAEWLSFKAHNGAHESALKGREPGTGMWFLEGSRLNEWMQNPASLLWLHGGVGCGKTVLCASTIERIRESRQNAACSSLCYFYCSFQDDSRQDLGALLRLFAAQLCSPATIPQQLQTLYDECRREYPPRTPRNEELIVCIVSILEDNETLDSQKSGQSPSDCAGQTSGSTNGFNAKNTYLVVDALDEIPIIEREKVLEFLQTLANLKLRRLHILVTSRTEPFIVEALALHWVPVVMDAATVNQDIRIYVSRTIEKHKKLRRQTPATKELIRQRLVEGGNGMFRWSALQMEELKRIEVAMSDTILAALAKLPKDLNETYERILTGIDDVLYQRALTALQWLVSSPRPMFIEELIEACAIDPRRVPIVDKDHQLTALNMFEMLHDLITIRPTLQDDADNEDGVYTVVIAHFSVQEFLTGNDIVQSEARTFRIQNEAAQLFIARSCLVYLFLYNSFEHRHERFPLREYAWYNWERHILPEHPVVNSQVRRKAMLIFKFLGNDFLDSKYVLATQRYPQWPCGMAICLKIFYLCLSWFAQILWIPSPMDVLMWNLAAAIDWLPQEGLDQLKDSLNTPYFFKDFDAFQSGSSSGLQYLYSGLQFERVGFRLLAILPALDEHAQMKCRLLPVSLEDHPPYDALSYTWGDHNDTQEAWVEGLNFRIGSNLARILRFVRARQELKAPRLWVDAICINQSDNEERAYMISHMGEIFQQAQEVVVGLGQECDGDERAIKALTELAALCPTSEPSISDEPNDKGRRFQELVLGLDREGAWPSILGLFRDPWWSRMWIIQEVILAGNATLFFGSLSLNFNVIAQVMMCELIIRRILEEKGSPDSPVFADFPGWDAACRITATMQEYRSGYSLTLPQLLYRFRTHVSSIPHDRIFSMYGITSEPDLIEPSYHHSLEELYLRLTTRLLDLHRTLDFLSYRSICRLSNTYTLLPSWVPTFDVWPDVLPLDPGIFGHLPTTNLFSTGGRNSKAFYETGGDSICLGGFTFDTIFNTGDVYLGEEYLSLTSVNDDSLRNIFDLSTIETNISQRPADQTAIEASWRTILADQWPPGQRLTESTLGRCKVPPRTKEEVDMLLQEPRLKESLKFIHRRQFMVTERGFIGLGPYKAKRGDIIAVIPGGAVPYVLRRVNGGTTTTPKYRFIGECYVHSIMDGEAAEAIGGATDRRLQDKYFILE